MPCNPQFERSRRSILLDFLRGLCLLVMTVDHLPQTFIKNITWQGVGFFSAAEGFIFLSGLVPRASPSCANGSAESRLSLSHQRGADVIPVSGCNGRICNVGQRVSTGLVPGGRTLLYLAAPAYSDILPMYCIFLLLLPAAMWALTIGDFILWPRQAWDCGSWLR
jgi:hypothetical protein